jgi:uncharacterized membrane protein YdjX (TVP38/TMEM64 family)
MTKRNLLKVVLFLLLAALVGAIWFSPLRAHLNREEIRAAVEQLRGVWYGPAAFVVLFAACCVVAIPASIFVISAGVIWGWKLGFLYALTGGWLGACASYAVGRFLGEGILERFGRLGVLVRKQVDHAGFKSMLILRLLPVFPFVVLNYGAGVARLRFADFGGATAIGMMPSALVFTYCADSLFNGSMSEGDALKRLFVVAALMICLVLIPTIIKKFVRTPVV